MKYGRSCAGARGGSAAKTAKRDRTKRDLQADEGKLSPCNLVATEYKTNLVRYPWQPGANPTLVSHGEFSVLNRGRLFQRGIRRRGRRRFGGCSGRLKQVL